MNRHSEIRFAALTCILGLLLSWPAAAHRMRPAIVTIAFNADLTHDILIQLNAEAMLAGIGPQHQDTDDAPNAKEYDALRELPPLQLERRIGVLSSDYLSGIHLYFDGVRIEPRFVSVEVPEAGDPSRERISTIRLAGRTPANVSELIWQYEGQYGSSAVRVSRSGEATVQSEFLNPGQASKPFLIGAPLTPKSRFQIAGEYLAIGFMHIVPEGLDHILFVLGIFLLSVRWRPLLYQVTAFTIAHTITLGLSLYGYISLPPGIVEPLIAVSIVYVGIENILTPVLKPWRIFVVFAFGLLHGMGFAGVLTEIGLPTGEYLNALISFNVGVELGQLTVIATAFFALSVWFRNRDWYRARVVIPLSAMISLIGAYWAIERTFGA